MSTITLNGNSTSTVINTDDIRFDIVSLNELSDVDTTGAINNKILKHNGTQFVIADLDSATVTEIDGGTY